MRREYSAQSKRQTGTCSALKLLHLSGSLFFATLLNLQGRILHKKTKFPEITHEKNIERFEKNNCPHACSARLVINVV
jgi:hypothetical protein